MEPKVGQYYRVVYEELYDVIKIIDINDSEPILSIEVIDRGNNWGSATSKINTLYK